jgi:hypothetical protein
MDAVTARKTWRTLEPLHGFVYFAPEALEELTAIGLSAEVGGTYFPSRAAPMGAVPAEVVIATFYNFRPSVVRASIPRAWDIVTPDEVIDARLRGAERALRRMLGAGADSPEIAEASELARQVALQAMDTPEGRPLFAAHASLDWPDEPLLVLWHAQTLLREYRGDGHIAALVTESVSGLEALVLHAATGEFPAAGLQSTRGWTDDEWGAATADLRARGWVDEGGHLTETGRAHRQSVEDRTDALALAPYAAIGEDGCTRLRALARPFAKEVAASLRL